jgi:hypothetical protein
MIVDLITIIITFYGGLVLLGFLTKWYIPLILFAILFGHSTHMDYMYLQKKDLYHALVKAWEDIFLKSALDKVDEEIANLEREMSMPGEEESLH